LIDKRWLLVCGVGVGVCLFIIFLVPFFVSADAFRPTIESQLTTALGRNVTMGKLSFSLMHGSLSAEDIAISDDPSFSNVPFIQAQKLGVGIEVIPFLLHKQVRITGLKIDTPSIQLIEHASGKWNYSTLGGGSTKPTGSQPSSDLSIGEFKIVNGSAMVSTIPVTAKPFQYTEVNLTIKQFSFSKSFPFDLSAKLPGDGTLKLTGEAGPIAESDTSQTPFHAALQLRQFSPVAGGIIDQNKGISMDNDIDAQISSDGTNITSTGKIKASRLQLVPKGSTAQDPVDIDYAVSEDLAARAGFVSDIAIHTGSAAAHVKGTFKFTSEAMMVNLNLSAPAIPVDQLERLLPVVGIHLPGGSSLQGGTLTANIAITGPATAATIAGPVEIDNAKLAGFDLASKIEGLNALGGSRGGTEIRVLKASLNSSPALTRISEIYAEVPQLGTATGEGIVESTGELNFHLTAKLNNSNTVGALTNRAVNAVGGLVGSFLHPKGTPVVGGNRSIPITITGSATNPSIRANIGAMLR
jgi:AsmA protein